MITNLFVTTVVCQAELFSRAARELEEVISSLPQNRVEEARKKVFEVIGNGGIQLAPTEKTKAQKGFDLFTGKAVPSDFKKDGKDKAPAAGNTSSTSIPTAVPVSATVTNTNKPAPPVVTAQVVKTSSTSKDPFVGGGNPFGKDDASPSAPPASSPATAVAPPSQRLSSPPPPPPTPAPPAPPASKPKVTVEALYDHEVSMLYDL